MPDEFHPYNDTCPHCGQKGTLRATITATATDVPLYDDGYEVDYGWDEDEMTSIICSACQQEVPVEYYYNEPSVPEIWPDDDN